MYIGYNFRNKKKFEVAGNFGKMEIKAKKSLRQLAFL